MDKIILSNLTDYQKSLLTRLAYIDIDFQEFQSLKKKETTITISTLKSLIKHPNDPYLGNLQIPKLKKFLTGITITTTEFIDEIKFAGLSDLEIIDFASDQKSGFNAICFKDSSQNIGFSFRGTDLKTLSSLATDGLADLEAFLTNNTEQIIEAQTLFNQNKNNSGQNFLYGHSLGGFLAEFVYLENHENISNIFVINPLHIDSPLLDNSLKIYAFNNPKKFQCFVTGGDYVSFINEPALFANNIRYVKNNNKSQNNPFGNHLIESAKFSKDGYFIECSKEEAFEGRTIPIINSAITIMNDKKIKRFFKKAFLLSKRKFKKIFRNNNKLNKEKNK